MSVHGVDRHEREDADDETRPSRDEPCGPDRGARLPQSPGDRGSRLRQIEDCARHKGDVLERRLARGVFLARSPALGMHTVLRVDSPKIIARQAAVLRFLALHSWPGAPRYCGAWQSDGVACLRVEYIADATALQLLLARSLTVDFLVDFQCRLARLLGSLHALGVVHLDVKPGNIAVRPDGTLCLLNWDRAQFLLAPVSDPSPPPLLACAAPEALSTLGAHPALDVWSFGACLVVLLTGQVDKPAHDALPADLCAKLPAGFAGVVRSALTADPRQRPSFRQLCNKYFSLRAVCWSDELLAHVRNSSTDAGEQFPTLAAARSRRSHSDDKQRMRASRSPVLVIDNPILDRPISAASHSPISAASRSPTSPASLSSPPARSSVATEAARRRSSSLHRSLD